MQSQFNLWRLYKSDVVTIEIKLVYSGFLVMSLFKRERQRNSAIVEQKQRLTTKANLRNLYPLMST
jgi:hypothetical protein